MSKYGYLNNDIFRRVIRIVLLFIFTLSSINVPQYVHAQASPVLPLPGTMVGLTQSYNPPVLKGIKVYPDNPLRFDFILDKGESKSSDTELKDQANKMIKYFLASLTVPEHDLWVNLSPYEKGRIVPKEFGQTEMGRDLLAQDYLLKQITASLMYPENEIGQKFWDKVYAEASKKFGSTDIPVDTFNKVWIVPQKAVVFENKGNAYVVESKLKVMLESDYVALDKAVITRKETSSTTTNEKQEFTKKIIREIIIPAIEKEVNTGKNFAQLRQVYNSLILAAWYKKKIKESLLSKIYVDKKKVIGINIDDPKTAEKIWAQYVESFKKGVYNYVKEEYDPVNQTIIPRKYFSGGFDAAQLFGNGMDSALVVSTDFEKVSDVQFQEDHDLIISSKILSSGGDQKGLTANDNIAQSISDHALLSDESPNKNNDLSSIIQLKANLQEAIKNKTENMKRLSDEFDALSLEITHLRVTRHKRERELMYLRKMIKILESQPFYIKMMSTTQKN
ncbi:MAG: hypothetical protein HQL26_07965 [Candidatus Omnitrophica bacterium]|nr:hypothetical protein [Candidatus Omnitrophota bacterium]